MGQEVTCINRSEMSAAENGEALIDLFYCRLRFKNCAKKEQGSSGSLKGVRQRRDVAGQGSMEPGVLGWVEVLMNIHERRDRRYPIRRATLLTRRTNHAVHLRICHVRRV